MLEEGQEEDESVLVGTDTVLLRASQNGWVSLLFLCTQRTSPVPTGADHCAVVAPAQAGISCSVC